MRILHLISHLRLGAGKHVVETSRAQARRGHHVMVGVSPDADSHWRTDPSMVTQLAQGGVACQEIGDFFHRDLNSLLASAKRLRLAQRWGKPFDVWHAHSGPAAAFARWSGADRVVMTCHGFGPRRDATFDLQDALAIGLADVVISPSRYWADRLETGFGVPRVHIIPYGLDLSEYPRVRNDRVQDKRPPFRILCLAELTWRKGVDLLIRAAHLVAARSGPLEIHLYGNGDRAEELAGLAREVPAGDYQILFHGYVENPYGQMPRFDLMCLPTRSDNLPLAVIEALLAELPVVATRIGGLPDLVDASGAGTLVRPESVEDLTCGLVEILKLGRAQLRTLGARGRAFVESNLEMNAVLDRLDRLYE